MIEADFYAGRVEKKLKAMRGKHFDDFAKQVVTDYALLHSREMDRRLKSGDAGIEKRTGASAKSVRWTKAKKVGGEWQATSRIGRGAPYLLAHEGDTPNQRSRTIKPKRASYLTVPILYAKTKGGKVRKGAELYKANKRYQTRGSIPGAADRKTFIFENSSRKKFIALKGRGKRILPIYVLKKRVKLPTNLGFVKTWRKQAGARRKLMRRRSREFIRRAA